MAELKTKINDQPVDEFIQKIADDQRRQDCQAVLALMQSVVGVPPKMWGESIVGFGSYRYRYASGREGDWPLVGFSPRKRNLTLYITSGFDEFGDLMQRLGKYSTGASCLYVNRLSDIDQDVLRTLVEKCVEHMKRTNPA